MLLGTHPFETFYNQPLQVRERLRKICAFEGVHPRDAQIWCDIPTNLPGVRCKLVFLPIPPGSPQIEENRWYSLPVDDFQIIIAFKEGAE